VTKAIGVASKINALSIETVAIDADCVGDRWAVENADRLARIVAIIAMGQATHAANIIQQLQSATPAFNHDALIKEAKRQLQIVGTDQDEKDASRWRRDGFVFEAISWIAAKQANGPAAFLKGPHLKSTTQGIDGLMIEFDSAVIEVIRATIFEDKCSRDPRKMFRDDVMKAFQDHHKNSRGPELVSTAAILIEKSGLDGTASVKAAARVLDLAFRRYRAALAVTSAQDSESARKALFKGYSALTGIKSDQRIGATFIVVGELRDWFDTIAASAIDVLNNWHAT
jgi:hypothetical protein